MEFVCSCALSLGTFFAGCVIDESMAGRLLFYIQIEKSLSFPLRLSGDDIAMASSLTEYVMAEPEAPLVATNDSASSNVLNFL